MAGQKARLAKAAAGIAVSIAVVVGADAIASHAQGFERAQAALGLGTSAEKQLSSGFSEGDDMPWAESVAGEAVGYQALPPWFERELCVLPGAGDVRVSSSGDVVGYAVCGDSAAAFASIREILAGKGWVESATGIEECSVFAKGEGECSWAMVSCIPIGETTSVVFRCVAA